MWNILSYQLLWQSIPEGVKQVAFGDDFALVVNVKNLDIHIERVGGRGYKKD